MEYLSEINENLHKVRETNKLLKRKVSETDKELGSLRLINLEQQRRIDDLELLLAKKTGDTICQHIETNTKTIQIIDANEKTVEILENSDYCDKHFKRIVTDLCLQSVKLGFTDYTECANYLKQEIRAKTGLECFVSVGQYAHYGYQNWIHKNKKFITLKINELLIVIFQVHTKFSDVLNCAKDMPTIEVLSKSEQIDVLFEERVIDLAKDIIQTTGFKSSIGISDFMRSELINRYGRIYGNNWLVTCGFGSYYDISYCVKNSKRKFLDFQMNELRFSIFQTL